MDRGRVPCEPSVPHARPAGAPPGRAARPPGDIESIASPPPLTAVYITFRIILKNRDTQRIRRRALSHTTAERGPLPLHHGRAGRWRAALTGCARPRRAASAASHRPPRGQEVRSRGERAGAPRVCRWGAGPSDMGQAFPTSVTLILKCWGCSGGRGGPFKLALSYRK